MSKLKKQAVNGIMWTTIRTIITSLIGPFLLLVKARFLTPEEFGVMAIVNIFLSIINIIENFGLSTAVIQRDQITKNERSSLFFFQVLFTTLISSLVVVTSPILANIFNMNSLERLLPLLSFVILFSGPAILFTAFLEKEFYFKELSIIQIVREIVLVLSTTIFLVRGWGLIGVVLGQIVAVLVMVILVLAVSFKKDLLHIAPHFKLHELKPYIRFGVYIGSKQLMTQLTHHVDELIIGYFLSAEVLGLYYFAKNLLNRLRSLISTSFAKVLLPLLSKVKNDRDRLTNAYNKISKYIGAFAFPTFIGIALTADLFIPAFFGEQWLDSVPFFAILSVAYIPYILTANLATSLLYSVNKPESVMYTDIIANFLYISLLLIFSWIGTAIYIIVALYAIYLIGKTTTLQFLTQQHLHSSFKNYLSLFKSAVTSTIIMSLAVSFIKLFALNGEYSLLELFACIVVGGTIYVLTYYTVDKKTLLEMKNLVFI